MAKFLNRQMCFFMARVLKTWLNFLNCMANLALASLRKTVLHVYSLGRVRPSWLAEVAGVTFSDSAPVPKFLNPDPGPAILKIWESDSCSDAGYSHWSNRNLPMFLLKKWPHRLLLLPKWKSDSGSGSGFSQIFDTGSGSGSERKTQNPAGVDSGTPNPVPPLLAGGCSGTWVATQLFRRSTRCWVSADPTRFGQNKPMKLLTVDDKCRRERTTENWTRKNVTLCEKNWGHDTRKVAETGRNQFKKNHFQKKDQEKHKIAKLQTIDFMIKKTLDQCSSTGVPRVAARGNVETDRNCLRQNSQPKFHAVVAVPRFPIHLPLWIEKSVSKRLLDHPSHLYPASSEILDLLLFASYLLLRVKECTWAITFLMCVV